MIRTPMLAAVVLGLLAPMLSADEPKTGQTAPAITPLPQFVRIADITRAQRIVTEITLEITQQVPEQRTGVRAFQKDGQTFTQEYTYTTYQTVMLATTHSAKDLRLTTLGGEEVPWQKANGQLVIRATTPEGLSEECKKLLAPETLVIVPTTVMAQIVPPVEEPKK